jgi:Der1-like family
MWISCRGRSHIARSQPWIARMSLNIVHVLFYNFRRYMKIPPVSRLYLTSAFMTTAACSVDIISPLTLYFNYDLVFHHGQFWRLITPYLFFGVFSVDFLFHMYFLVRFCFVPCPMKFLWSASIAPLEWLLTIQSFCLGTIQSITGRR